MGTTLMCSLQIQPPLPVSTSAVPMDQRQNAPEKNNLKRKVFQRCNFTAADFSPVPGSLDKQANGGLGLEVTKKKNTVAVKRLVSSYSLQAMRGGLHQTYRCC